MWPTSEVETALRRGYEVREVEVKRACRPRDTHEFGRIARAVLAMSNMVDGGRVIVGIDEPTMASMVPGLTQDQLAGWQDHDHVRDLIGRYADSPLAIERYVHQLGSGATVVVLEVPGLDGIPHFCRRSLRTADNRADILREGALYVRSIRRPESVEVASRAEMEEILESAVTARLRAFVQTAQRAGVTLGTAAPAPVQEADSDMFAQQRREGWGNR